MRTNIYVCLGKYINGINLTDSYFSDFTITAAGVHILLVATMCCSATQYPASCDPLDTPPGTPLDNKYLMIRQPSGGFYKPKITDTYYQYVYYKFSQGCNMIVDSASITMRGDCTYTTSVSFDLASGTTTGRKLSTVTRSSCDDICNQTLTVAQGKLNLANRGTERMMIVMTIVRLSVKASSKLENCSVASRSAPKLGLHLDFRLRLRGEITFSQYSEFAGVSSVCSPRLDYQIGYWYSFTMCMEYGRVPCLFMAEITLNGTFKFSALLNRCIMKETNSRSLVNFKGFETTCVAFYTPEIHFASQGGKMSSRTTGIRTRDLLPSGQIWMRATP